MGHSSPLPPPYEAKENKKAALVVGHFGVGLKIVTELVKEMNVAVAYASDSDAEQVERELHNIKGRKDVRTANCSPLGALNSKHVFPV